MQYRVYNNDWSLQLPAAACLCCRSCFFCFFASLLLACSSFFCFFFKSRAISTSARSSCSGSRPARSRASCSLNAMFEAIFSESACTPQDPLPEPFVALLRVEWHVLELHTFLFAQFTLPHEAQVQSALFESGSAGEHFRLCPPIGGEHNFEVRGGLCTRSACPLAYTVAPLRFFRVPSQRCAARMNSIR